MTESKLILGYDHVSKDTRDFYSRIDGKTYIWGYDYNPDTDHLGIKYAQDGDVQKDHGYLLIDPLYFSPISVDMWSDVRQWEQSHHGTFWYPVQIERIAAGSLIEMPFGTEKDEESVRTFNRDDHNHHHLPYFSQIPDPEDWTNFLNEEALLQQYSHLSQEPCELHGGLKHDLVSLIHGISVTWTYATDDHYDVYLVWKAQSVDKSPKDPVVYNRELYHDGMVYGTWTVSFEENWKQKYPKPMLDDVQAREQDTGTLFWEDHEIEDMVLGTHRYTDESGLMPYNSDNPWHTWGIGQIEEARPSWHFQGYNRASRILDYRVPEFDTDDYLPF